MGMGSGGRNIEQMCSWIKNVGKAYIVPFSAFLRTMIPMQQPFSLNKPPPLEPFMPTASVWMKCIFSVGVIFTLRNG